MCPSRLVDMISCDVGGRDGSDRDEGMRRDVIELEASLRVWRGSRDDALGVSPSEGEMAGWEGGMRYEKGGMREHGEMCNCRLEMGDLGGL